MYFMSDSWLGLEGKAVAVTGATSGIGQGIALAFAQQGAIPVLIGRDKARLDETADLVRAFGVEPKPFICDVADQSAVTEVAQKAGVVDILVNNSGISKSDTLEDISLENWEAVLKVNLTGMMVCSQAFGKGMLAQGSGALVHITSISGRQPQANGGAYSPSKAAAIMLMRQYAFEWGPRGVRSNSISPGMTRTPLTEAYYNVGDVAERRAKAVPVGRVGVAQDMADVALFLASDRAGYINGADIIVDGGFETTLMSTVPRPGY